MSTPNLHSLPDDEAAGGICFVGEQDGLPEGELKRELANLFIAGIGVRKAYLARIIYKGQTAERIALCIRADPGMESDIALGVGAVFSRLFNQDMSMDIIFMDQLREDRLAVVCHPFFSG